MNSVDVGMLRCFVMAVDCRSLSAAAKALDISQPAISKKLQKLEHALGAPLLERTSKGVQPTVYGSAYYAHVQSILGELERGGLDLERLQGQAPREFRIGAAPSLMELVLAPALARYSVEWPSVHFQVRLGDQPDLMLQLEHREIDLLLTESGTEPFAEGIERRVVAQACQSVYVGRDHPLAKASDVSYEQLQACRWILHDLPLFRESFQSMFESVSLPAPQPVVLSQSLRFLLSMTQEADLVAFMPEHLAQAAVTAGRLVRLNFEIEPWVSDIIVCYRRQFADSVPMVSLVTHIEAICSDSMPDLKRSSGRFRA